MSHVDNHCQTVTTDAGRFMLTQRNVGFESNDGKWVVTQLVETYWGPAGALRQRRPGAFLGVADTREGADAMITGAALQPIEDKMIL